jgi:hypothetical protein
MPVSGAWSYQAWCYFLGLPCAARFISTVSGQVGVNGFLRDRDTVPLETEWQPNGDEARLNQGDNTPNARVTTGFLFPISLERLVKSAAHPVG